MLFQACKRAREKAIAAAFAAFGAMFGLSSKDEDVMGLMTQEPLARVGVYSLSLILGFGDTHFISLDSLRPIEIFPPSIL